MKVKDMYNEEGLLKLPFVQTVNKTFVEEITGDCVEVTEDFICKLNIKQMHSHARSRDQYSIYNFIINNINRVYMISDLHRESEVLSIVDIYKAFILFDSHCNLFTIIIDGNTLNRGKVNKEYLAGLFMYFEYIPLIVIYEEIKVFPWLTKWEDMTSYLGYNIKAAYDSNSYDLHHLLGKWMSDDRNNINPMVYYFIKKKRNRPYEAYLTRDITKSPRKEKKNDNTRK